MTQARFANIPETDYTPEQRRVHDELVNGPRGGLRGPFGALLQSPDLADRVRQLGDYIRFGNSLTPALREFVILLTARFWMAQYEWYAHRKLSAEAGVNPAHADAIEVGKRPANMSADETLLYDFVQEMLNQKDVSDKTYAAAVARFGEKTMLDVICTSGYFGFVSLILNTKRHPVPDGSAPLKPL
ncbi:MAG TPA: carboxymuconolactone decarboxylase family protein [Burkholderiales bacterium]|jgi:4-carboxymuconolactone decarboxylase